MRKKTIIFLISTMTIVSCGLLYAQFKYFMSYTQMLEVHFRELVELSLNQTTQYINEREALSYLSETMISNGLIEGSKLTPASIDSAFCRKDDGLRITLSNKHGEKSLDATLNTLRVEFQKNFERSKTIVDQTVFHWLRETENKPVTERINFVELGDILNKMFESNNVTNAFYYDIVDNTDKLLYSSHSHIRMGENVIKFRQTLFPREHLSQPVFLQVYFIGKGDYVVKSILSFLPTIILTIIVMLVFIYAVFIILQQNRVNIMKNDFINNMTHEFKTPISTVSLASQMLQDNSVSKTPSLLSHISNVIADETKRLSFQVEKVLQMAMFERDKSILKLTEIPINELIKDIVGTFSLKVERKGGQISSNLLAANDLAMVDEVHFTNIIYNLMDNALKYSEKPLLLNISTLNNKEGELIIQIEDNGIGIKKEDQKRIFEKFYRVSTGNLHNIKGFGMGLAYVKKMVTEHKGSITVESEFNIGTKFIIKIPTL